MIPPYCSFHCQRRSDKLVAPKIVAGQAFFLQFFLDDVLRRDAGMIHSWQPQCVETLHALAADNHVVNRVVEHVTHVQRTGHIWRRHDENETAGAGVGVCAKISPRFPQLIPATFYFLRVVGLRDLIFQFLFLVFANDLLGDIGNDVPGDVLDNLSGKFLDHAVGNAIDFFFADRGNGRRGGRLVFFEDLVQP